MFEKTKTAKMMNDYAAAKEQVDMKLMEAQAECVENHEPYTLDKLIEKVENETGMEINGVYYGETSKIKSSVKAKLDNSTTGLTKGTNGYDYDLVNGN